MTERVGSLIPQADPGLQYRRHRDAIDAAIRRVLASGRYILGPEVESFEAEFAAYCGVRHAVGVGNGTDAIRLALRALSVGAGDEVIVPAHTAVATVAAVELTGALPVLVDIRPDTYCLDPAAVEAAVTPRTRAIVAVHLYGHPVDLGALSNVATRHSVSIVEDCAQAHGALWQSRRVGSVGAVGCFSFYPTKNLGALGDGGAVVTNDRQLAERVRLLRQYGWAERNLSLIGGENSRLDELQAAVLRVKLGGLEAETDERRRLADLLTAQLQTAVDTPVERPDCRHVYHLYVIASRSRDDLRARLSERGIGTAIHYPFPIHVQPAYEGRLGDKGQFPIAERCCERVLSLPLYPGLGPEDMKQVAEAVRSVAPSRAQ